MAHKVFREDEQAGADSAPRRRGSIAALRRVARPAHGCGCRHLHLGDSLAAELAIEKGRSSSFGLMGPCRRVLALSAASGSRFFFRWLPSEWNVVDGASRLWEAARVAARAGRHEETSGRAEDARIGALRPTRRRGLSVLERRVVSTLNQQRYLEMLHHLTDS